MGISFKGRETGWGKRKPRVCVKRTVARMMRCLLKRWASCVDLVYVVEIALAGQESVLAMHDERDKWEKGLKQFLVSWV